MHQLIGNAPNQVPTNADLGGMAYQDPRYVNVTGGNVNVTNMSAANVVLGAVTTGNILSSGNITINDTTESTAYNSGALIVAGGVGIGANLYVSGNTTISGNLTVQNITYENREVVTTTETVQGNLVAAASTTSISTTTGALVAAGGAGIAGNIYAGGQVSAALGLYSSGAFNGGYSDGTVIDYTAGVGRISVGTADNLKFYQGGPASTESLVIAATTGNIVIPATTTATSTTTGALVVKGGAGIADGLYVNGVTYLQNFSTANGHIISSDSAIGINHLNTVSAIGNIYSVAAQVTNFSSSNVLITGGYATGMANVTAGNLYVTDVSTIDYASNSVMPKSYTDAFSIIFGA